MVAGVIRLKQVIRFECPYGDQIVEHIGYPIDDRFCTRHHIKMDKEYYE